MDTKEFLVDQDPVHEDIITPTIAKFVGNILTKFCGGLDQGQIRKVVATFNMQIIHEASGDGTYSLPDILVCALGPGAIRFQTPLQRVVNDEDRDFGFANGVGFIEVKRDHKLGPNPGTHKRQCSPYARYVSSLC